MPQTRILSVDLSNKATVSPKKEFLINDLYSNIQVLLCIML